MTRNLKQALFSALLVWAVAYPVLGLKLTIVGINLEVHGTSDATLITIAVCSVLMFLRVLFDQQISSAWRSRAAAASTPEGRRCPGRILLTSWGPTSPSTVREDPR